MSQSEKSIGQKIKETRLKAGFSQEDLAELAEVHVSYIGQIERGEKSPSVSVLVRISKALQVPLSQLLDSQEHGSIRFKGNPKWRQIVKLSEDLNEEALDALLRLIHILRKYERQKQF